MTDRCRECGSWDRECDNPTPVTGCGCARCGQHTLAAATQRAEKAEAERDTLRAQILDGFRVGGALTCETQTPEEMAADLVRQVREAREQRDQYRREKDTAEFGLGHVTVERDAALEELKKRTEERDALRAKLAEAEAWTEDDRPLPEDVRIHDAHPLRSGDHARYLEAMRLVGAKRSKYALVDLVNWLLARIADSERTNAAAREEQREADSICEQCCHLKSGSRECEASDRDGERFCGCHQDHRVRSTPLTTTPLADEIARLTKELERAHKAVKQHNERAYKLKGEIDCFRCTDAAEVVVVFDVDRRGLPELTVSLPEGWEESTWSDCGEKRYSCPKCTKGLR